jgi:urea carboxylase system permease
MAAYVMVGFDSAGELSEETHDPRRTAPRAILRALVVSGVGGALLLLGGILAAPSLTNGDLAGGGLPYVVTSNLTTPVGKLLLADVAIAISVCTLAIQTAAMRMIFSLSRDGALPFSPQLARVSPRTGTPLLPALVTGALAIAILVVNVGEASIFLALTSVCIVMLYGAYLLVTVPMLLGRLGLITRPAELEHEGLFSLGRHGLAINIVAVAYGFLMMVNLAWPREAVYDPAGGHWYLRYFALLFVGGTLLLGLAVYAHKRRGRWAHAPVRRDELATVGVEG